MLDAAGPGICRYGRQTMVAGQSLALPVAGKPAHTVRCGAYDWVMTVAWARKGALVRASRPDTSDGPSVHAWMPMAMPACMPTHAAHATHMQNHMHGHAVSSIVHAHARMPFMACTPHAPPARIPMHHLHARRGLVRCWCDRVAPLWRTGRVERTAPRHGHIGTPRQQALPLDRAELLWDLHQRVERKVGLEACLIVLVALQQRVCVCARAWQRQGSRIQMRCWEDEQTGMAQ